MSFDLLGVVGPAVVCGLALGETIKAALDEDYASVVSMVLIVCITAYSAAGL